MPTAINQSINQFLGGTTPTAQGEKKLI